MSSMKNIQIEKVTLNIGAGKEQTRLEKGIKLLKMISGREPIKTITNKRIPGWGLRPGLPIGCKVTLRKKEAEEIIKRTLDAKEFKLIEDNFDNKAVIKVNNKYVDEVRTALSLSEIPLRVVGVSGILKKAEEKFIGG